VVFAAVLAYHQADIVVRRFAIVEVAKQVSDHAQITTFQRQ
jgi:hypothetical protein